LRHVDESMFRYVRYSHLADIVLAPSDVRFRG
jgi:hypothetical protein